MERFCLWRDIQHPSGQESFEVLTMSYNSCELDLDNVYYDIEKALKSSNNLPDCVYIIGNSIQCAVYRDAWGSGSNRKDSMLMRGMKFGMDYVKQYVFLEWKETKFSSHVLGASKEIYKCDTTSLLTRGMYALLDRNNAIHQAPSGHTFKHPSGNLNKLYIQAREIARDEAELFVVGYTLASRYGAKLRDSKKIFIDTMGIYAYVKNALDLCGSQAEILSFHSYDELENLNPPSVAYFCIVSASTSGRMAKIMADRQFAEDRIATLVDVKSVGRCGDVIVSLESMGVSFPDLDVKDGTLIEIIGENFTSKAKPPRSVVIALSHVPESLNEVHKYFAFSVAPFNSNNGGRNKLLYLNAKSILENENFNNWLDAEINWSFPLTISHVICANDETSKLLAAAIIDRLKIKLIKGNDIQLIAQDNMESSGFKNATGVVVVTAVARDGGVLREISRDLRSYIKAEVVRHFIAPVGIPRTSASWKQLVTFLTKNPTSRNYGFSNWIQMPIGDDTRQDIWKRLANLGSTAQNKEANEFAHLCNLSSEDISTSLELAANEIDRAYNSFLNSPRGETLTLSEGFLFFAKDSDIAKRYSEVSQSAIYLTMSAVLQCAREHKDHSKRLCPTGYESVVLGPECFLRFNDAVLQACLLRASLPSELDYSASPVLSKLMREFLSKIFARCDKKYGDAALEFAAAIALGSLRLTCEDSEILFEEIFRDSTQPSALLGLLILARIERGAAN